LPGVIYFTRGLNLQRLSDGLTHGKRTSDRPCARLRGYPGAILTNSHLVEILLKRGVLRNKTAVRCFLTNDVHAADDCEGWH
jgi:hypothetical protein